MNHDEHSGNGADCLSHDPGDAKAEPATGSYGDFPGTGSFLAEVGAD